MTASVTSERPGKRDRLIAGARETIYRQGIEATTIADIAEASDVPLGNVYYYFKSKDELVAAAIDSYAQDSRERLSWLEQQHPQGSPEDACPAARVAVRSGGAVRLPERELVLRTRQAR
jgi:AcrR family transcriptional regulator